MRLINTLTRQLEEFNGSKLRERKYAILSHTWEETGEVTYSDYVSGKCHGMPGYEKINKTCELALEAGIPYAWVDTCCIDKSSSAELTEAINSMFRWYERAVVCYVYLSDLTVDSKWKDAMSCCRWYVVSYRENWAHHPSY